MKSISTTPPNFRLVNKGISALLFALLFLISVIQVTHAQTTVFTDDFSANQSATFTTTGAIGASSWSITRSGNDWGGRRHTTTSQLELSNDVSGTGNSNGWVRASTPSSSFSSPYNTTLSSNTGIVTWTFNMRQIRTDPSGFAASEYGAAFILAGTSTTNNNTGSGYAVVLGQGGGTDPIRLATYTNGVQGTLTNLITSNTSGLTDFGTDFLSVKVTYAPHSDTWELFLRNDGGAAFSDPAGGSLTSQGTVVNTTHTATTLAIMGAWWQGSTAGTQTAFFDNTKVTIGVDPYLVATPKSLAFGSQALSTNSLARTFSVVGNNLTGFPADITVTAPTHFQVSNDNSTWGSTTTIAFSSATLTSTTVYVRFSPTTTGAKSGNITFSGVSGLVSSSVAVSGTCPAAANTKVWAGGASGNWNTAGSWSPSGVPAAGDVVTFNSPSAIACAVNADPNTLASLTVSGTAVIFTSSGAGRTITLNNAGTALDIKSGASVTLRGSTGSGTRSMNLVFAGSGNTSQIAGALTVTDVGEGTSFNASNSTTTVSGTLTNDGNAGGTAGTITSTASNLLFDAGSNYVHARDGGTIPTADYNATSTCSITGNDGAGIAGLTQTFGNFIWNSTGQSASVELDASMTILGNFTVSSTGSSSLRMSDNATGRTISVSGNYIQTGGEFRMNNSTGSCTMNVTGNVTISGSSIFTLVSGAANSTLNIDGNLSLSTGTIRLSEDANIGTINLQGDFTQTSGTITETSSGSGNIVFNGTGTSIYTSGGTYSNLINTTINSGVTVDFGTSVISSACTGTFTLSSGAGIITANNAGLTSSGAAGTVQSTGTRTYNSAASYEFKGSNTGAFTLTTPNTITSTLTFNRALGVTIDQNFTATTLGLTLGAVTTGSNAITIPSGGTFTGGSSTAYVSGILRRVFPSATTLVFPVGKGGNYRPVTFQYTAVTGTSTVTIEQFESALTGTLPASTNLNNGRTWNISQTGGSALSYKVTLDGTGDVISGAVVMLKKESGTITAHAVTTPDYTNTSNFTTLTGTVNFTLGSTCTITADAGVDQTSGLTCGLSSVTLAAATPAFGTGQWSIISGIGGSFSGGSGNPSNSNLTNATFNGTSGSTYVLQWTISNGACSDNNQMTVTLNANPTTANAGTDQIDGLTCGITTVNLAANTPTNGSGTWTIQSGVGGSFSNAASETSTFSGVSGSTYVLRWTISNMICTDSEDEMTVTFNEEPSVSDAGTDQSFCGGTSIALAANTPVIGTGAWTIVSGPSLNLSQFSSTSNPVTIFTEDGGLGDYTLEWTITNGPCTSSSTVTVSAIAGPWVGAISTDWFDADNWCGGVPTSTTDVYIPNGATFYPSISAGSVDVQSITIESNGSLTITGGDLTSGDILNDGTFTINAGGTLDLTSSQMSGTGDLVMDGTFITSKAAGFSGTASTSIMNTITILSLGTSSTVDYSSSGSQTITEANYANLTNTGNGNRILSATGTIGISGVFSAGTGDYTVSNSTVEFNGTSAQTVPALAPDSKYNNLEINNNSGVSMVADLNLEDGLFLTDGAFTTTGFDFTLLSSGTQTARIAPITGGSIVGEVIMQRFVPGGTAGWVTIGMPVGGRTLADWDDDIITSGFNGSSTGSGTFINIYTYNESIGGNADAAASYVPATDITNTVDPKEGYFVFIADNATTVADKNIDVKGPPLTGTQNLDVTFTANTNVDEDGWNLVNNPYCSAIDWTSVDWTKTNMDDAIYIFDADNAQYTGYVDGVSFNGGNEIIASSQSFLVHANAASPFLVAEEGVKTDVSPTFYKTLPSAAANGLLRIQLDGLGGTYKDETIFRTRANATNQFDRAYDAYKLASFDFAAPSICTFVNGVKYVVNSIDELTENLDLPLKVTVNTPGSYTLNFSGLENFSNINCLTLEDKLTNTTIDLHIDSTYTFTSAIDTAAAYNRFVIHFGIEALVASVVPSATIVSLPNNAIVNFTNTSTGATAYSWDFGDGSPIETGANPSHEYTAAGQYTVTLIASNSAGCTGPQTITIQITVDDVTGVNTTAALESVNLVKDAQGVLAHYNFKNATKVVVTIYDNLGQKINESQQIMMQNKGVERIDIPSLPKGIYTIELLYNNSRISRKLDF